jgi:hypothetical protein
MMDRRRSLMISLAAALAAPLAAGAQSAAKTPSVALFSLALAPERIEAFRDGLRQLGYADRQNVVIEVRDAHGKADRLSWPRR